MAERIFVSVQEGIKEPDWIQKAEEFERAVLKKLGFNGEEISVLFCNDAFIRELNMQYRNIDAPTDILSFEDGSEYEDEEGKWFCAGDIIISLDTLPVNAAYFGVSENEELKRLLIHGTLHLNGMDHGDAHIEKNIPPEDEMLKLQEKTLSELKEINIIT